MEKFLLRAKIIFELLFAKQKSTFTSTFLYLKKVISILIWIKQKKF